MKKLPKDLKTMPADALQQEYTERNKHINEMTSYLWDNYRWHNEKTVDMVAENQRHTKTAQKYFRLQGEIKRIEAIAAHRGCALDKG